MTPEQLWNDHTFRTLLNDLFKARKDDALGPMRLGVLLGYIGKEPQARTIANLAPSPVQIQAMASEPPLERLSPTPEENGKQEASAIEIMLKKIDEAGKQANGRPFSVVFDKGEGQAIQEIGVYLEKFNSPYRLVVGPFGADKSFDPKIGWVVNFAKVM